MVCVDLHLSNSNMLHTSHVTTKEHVDTLHDIILFRIVRVLLGRDFQNSGNRGVIILQNVSDIIGNVLVDEDDANVIPSREVLERFFYLLQLCVLLDNQEVGTARRAMPNTS